MSRLVFFCKTPDDMDELATEVRPTLLDIADIRKSWKLKSGPTFENIPITLALGVISEHILNCRKNGTKVPRSLYKIAFAAFTTLGRELDSEIFWAGVEYARKIHEKYREVDSEKE